MFHKLKFRLDTYFQFFFLRFSIRANVFFYILGGLLLGLGVLSVLHEQYVNALTCAIGGFMEMATVCYYSSLRRGNCKRFGISEVNTGTGEIHSRTVNLTGMDTKTILEKYRLSYEDIVRIVENSRGKTVRLVSHKSLIRQMYNILRDDCLSELNGSALNFLFENMIKYNDREPIELSTDERYFVYVSYVGFRNNHAYALRYHLPFGKAYKKFITPIPYFEISLVKHV